MAVLPGYGESKPKKINYETLRCHNVIKNRPSLPLDRNRHGVLTSVSPNLHINERRIIYLKAQLLKAEGVSNMEKVNSIIHTSKQRLRLIPPCLRR